MFLPLPYVRCLLSRSRMCLGRHCRGHPVHVYQVGGCPHMSPWVGPHSPYFGRQLRGLLSHVEYLSPQGVFLTLIHSTTASALWLELRGHSAWQATPSWTVYRLTYHRLFPWLWVTFAMVPDAAWPGSDQRPWSIAPATGLLVGWFAPVRPTHRVLVLFLSLGRPRCVRCPGPCVSCSPMCPRGFVVFAMSWATWLLFTGAPARCVVLRGRCPQPLGSCSAVCSLSVLC